MRRMTCTTHRAVPIIFQRTEAQKKQVEQLMEALKGIIDLCEKQAESEYTLRGWFANIFPCCIGETLFHETKQMGMILQHSFKGTHFWIPPLKDQVKQIEQV